MDSVGTTFYSVLIHSSSSKTDNGVYEHPSVQQPGSFMWTKWTGSDFGHTDNPIDYVSINSLVFIGFVDNKKNLE